MPLSGYSFVGTPVESCISPKLRISVWNSQHQCYGVIHEATCCRHCTDHETTLFDIVHYMYWSRATVPVVSPRMSKITRTINFPEGLASKILWSPNVDEDSGRSSRSSYVLVAPNSHSHMTSPSVEDLAPENKGESITETKVFDVSDEPVPPIADVSSVVLDGATEPH
ncbi:hypothetical protein BDQ17DRAFT_651478 [Cyathus striatus]|nr:hypothetical protein BDQ17DRAFT_651478 [Cyathus striatus]